MAIFYGYFMSVILFNAALCEFDPTMLGQVKSKYFAFDIKNLKGLWHNALIRGVIKARANELLPYVSRVEKAVYEQCVSEAKSTVSLAKCAVRVFDSSNHMKKKTMLTKTKKSKSFITVIVHKKSSKHWMYIPQNFTVKRRTGSISHSAYGFKISNNSKVSPIKKQTRKQPKKWSMLESEKPMRRPSFSASLFPKKPFAAEREFVESLTNDSSRRTRRTKRESGTTNNGLSVNFRDVAMKYLQKMFGKSSNTSNLDNLRILHDHFKNTDKINNFFKQMNEENRRLYEKVALPIDSRTPEIANEAESAVEQILAIVNSFAANKTNTDKISVLSPRLLSLFPETSSVNRFLSPTFFSFQKSGYLSLPELFDIISSDQKYQQLMLDIVMDVSGAGTILEGLMTKLKPEMDKVKRVKLPLVDELSKNDQTWIKMHNSFSREQAEDYEEKGYAFMNEDQLNLIYTKRDQLVSGMNVTKLGLMSKQEKIKRLEEAIRQMAALGQPEWPIWDNVRKLKKRQLSGDGHIEANTTTLVDEKNPSNHMSEETESEERINGILYETFRPHAFTSILSRGAAMEVVTLSPHAFISEIARPEALKLETLSPRAFIASILSPTALLARVLSPTALRAEVLSPRVFHTWILSPEALVTEILSPRAFDPRVLSPKVLIIDVLSPGFLSPHVLSSEIAGVIILSPNILSPRVAGSEEELLVEVLSPHILGGPHKHEKDSQEAEHESPHNSGGPHKRDKGSHEAEHESPHNPGGPHKHDKGSHEAENSF